MIYPKQKLMDIGGSNIGINVFNGVYWFHITEKDEKNIQKLNELRQSIIKSREKESNIIQILKTNSVRTVIINKDIYNIISNKILEEIYAENPDFPKTSPINIDKLREKEINTFVNYINQIPLNNKQIDVYLYKTRGERVKSIYFTDKKRNLKKNIYGFYLTKEDLEIVNKKLAPSNKRISNIIPKELLDIDYGIRFTLDLDEAIIINQ